jgi:hypothetical protein
MNVQSIDFLFKLCRGFSNNRNRFQKTSLEFFIVLVIKMSDLDYTGVAVNYASQVYDKLSLHKNTRQPLQED